MHLLVTYLKICKDQVGIKWTVLCIREGAKFTDWVVEVLLGWKLLCSGCPFVIQNLSVCVIVRCPVSLFVT